MVVIHFQGSSTAYHVYFRVKTRLTQGNKEQEWIINTITGTEQQSNYTICTRAEKFSQIAVRLKQSNNNNSKSNNNSINNSNSNTCGNNSGNMQCRCINNAIMKYDKHSYK